MANANDSQSELLQLFGQLFDNLAAPMREHIQELQAQQSAQNFLLETLYANHFLNNPQGFDQFMRGALDVTRSKPVRTGPMTPDEAAEAQARVAARLQRFHESVARRLEQGPRD